MTTTTTSARAERQKLADVTEVLRAAFAAPVKNEQPMGCCRVYVSVDKENAKLIKKAAKALGKLMQTRSYYGASNALYVGYDNHDGDVLAQATAVMAALKSQGISCYRSEGLD